MTDLFADQATGWDDRPLPQRISDGVTAAILARVPLRAGQTALDFGAGTGLLAARIAPLVASVVAVDVSPAMLGQLAGKPELRDKVEPICQDLLQAPLGRRFGLVVSAMAMHHVQDTAALLRVLAAHLEPGGHMALADLDREEGDFHPAGVEGVFHHGFDRHDLALWMGHAGLTGITIETACEVDKDGKRYPIFLATATKDG